MNLSQSSAVAAVPPTANMSFCSVWSIATGILSTLLPLVPNADVKKALSALLAAGNAFCSSSDCTACTSGDVSSDDARRALSSAIINKAVADPEWRARLIDNPEAAIKDDSIDALIQLMSAGGADLHIVPCLLSLCNVSGI
ncbi:MAG: hypothetical protein ACLGI6_05275 [Gammaproteobacteria bacterium]